MKIKKIFFDKNNPDHFDDKNLQYHLIEIDRDDLIIMKKMADHYYDDYPDLDEDIDCRSYIDNIYQMIEDYDEELRKENIKDHIRNLQKQLIDFEEELRNL